MKITDIFQTDISGWMNIMNPKEKNIYTIFDESRILHFLVTFFFGYCETSWPKNDESYTIWLLGNTLDYGMQERNDFVPIVLNSCFCIMFWEVKLYINKSCEPISLTWPSKFVWVRWVSWLVKCCKNVFSHVQHCHRIVMKL